MKYVKFFVGLLLFIAPIAMYTTAADNWTMHAPIGTLARSNVFFDTTFQVHTFKWYTNDGQNEYIVDVFTSLHTAGIRVSSFMLEGIGDKNLTTRGIFTILTLWGVAFYLVLQIIDKKQLNLAGDIFMIGLASINLFSFFNYNKILFSYNFALPIFSIVAGVLGIVGLVFSALDLQKKTRRRRK